VGVGIDGNEGANTTPGAVGITFDTTATGNGSRGHFLVSGSTIGNFSADSCQITSTGTNDQAVGAEFDYVACEHGVSGNALTVTNTTDVKLNRFFGELSGGCGLRVIGSRSGLTQSQTLAPTISAEPMLLALLRILRDCPWRMVRSHLHR
jgi:hypothetical protein